jgi:uncharacterized protein YdeI (YjbR/CyaY-like superfamily)
MAKNEVPLFFASAEDFREWLAANHASATEQWVGFYRKATGRPSVTWPESVDEALCVGWIDGIRKRIDESSYKIRFTPRKRGSTWSAVNIARVAELQRAGRMQPAGLAAFAARTEAKSAIYAYEQRTNAKLDEPSEAEFRKNPGAWEFFKQQPPWYRRTACWWVISAKKPETRAKRLATLIADSAECRTLKHLTRDSRRNWLSCL